MIPAPLPREILMFTIAQLLDGVRHVAVGASSPIVARTCGSSASAATGRALVLSTVDEFASPSVQATVPRPTMRIRNDADSPLLSPGRARWKFVVIGYTP